MIPSDFSLLFVFATNFNVVATFYCTWILEGLQWGKSQPTLNVMCSCCCSATQPWPILCDPVDYRLQASLSFTISQSYSNSCPLSQWCHPTISCLQCFPASGSFLMSQLFASGGQSIGVSASASVLPMNIHDWYRLGLTGWISLQPKGLARVFSNITVQKHQFFSIQRSAFFMVQLSYLYMTTGKTIALTIWTFVSKVMSLLFNTLSKFVIAFLPRSKRLLISWLQSLSAGILKPKIIVCHCFHCFPIYLPWTDGTELVFLL